MNEGKIFEANIKNSVPDYYLLKRFNDTSQAYQKSVEIKFTPRNSCDFMGYNSITHYLYFLECKSTKKKYISYSLNKDITKRMIQYHQIKDLTKLSKYNGVISGFLFNFRDEINSMQRTYFQDINDFNKMCKCINKNSFNEINLINFNGIKIKGIKKITNYIWDLDNLFKEVEGKYEY